MAVTKLTCPECNTVLKPVKPIPPGKPVKCPECGNRFTVPEEDGPKASPKKTAAAAPETIASKPKKPAGAIKSSPNKPIEKKAAPVAKKPAAKKSDDNEDAGVYGYIKEEETAAEQTKPEIEYAPDMSTKDLRGPAAAALVQPSNALIIVGGLGFLGWLALLFLVLFPKLFPIESDQPKDPKAAMSQPAANNPGAPPGKKADDPNRRAFLNLYGMNLTLMAQWPLWIYLLWLIPMIVGMVYAALVTYGGVTIQNLESRNWGIASSIMAMVPLCSGGFMAATAILLHFLVGMAVDDENYLFSLMIFVNVVEMLVAILVGVWVLMTLLSETVVKGYEYRAE